MGEAAYEDGRDEDHDAAARYDAIEWGGLLASAMS